MHEFFEHTADLGLRARATSLNALFVDAGTCLFTAIVDDLSTVKLEHEKSFAVAGDDREFLLFDWLRALLYEFDAEHWLFGRFEVDVNDTGLIGKAWGELLNPERHMLSHEVKAITYHELRVERDGDSWIAEVIVDI